MQMCLFIKHFIVLVTDYFLKIEIINKFFSHLSQTQVMPVFSSQVPTMPMKLTMKRKEQNVNIHSRGGGFDLPRNNDGMTCLSLV